MSARSQLSPDRLFLAGALTGLVAGAAAGGLEQTGAAHTLWALTTLAGLIPAIAWVVESLRRREPGVDVIAVLALIGTLVVGEYLAGAVISLMLATGRALEARANARAERDLHALVARAPNVAHRYEDDALAVVAVSSVVPGDRLLIRPGEVVAVDGIVESGPAVLDESALTGEPVPVELAEGRSVPSGVVNAGGPFDMRATTAAAESTYAGIVRLVEQAQAGSAPLVHLADRYALVFLPVALAIAVLAGLASGDLVRAVAVLVVATPCPLILAAPIAIVAGLSQAARRGVVVKGGGALEELAVADVLLLDKTGTLTAGRPTLLEVLTSDDDAPDEVLRMAASLEQLSPHVVASAVVTGARDRGLALALPAGVEEVTGQGVRGVVDGRSVSVGKLRWVTGDVAPSWARAVTRRAEREGLLTVFVGAADRLAGALLLDDPIRPDARRTLRRLRRDGVRRIVMVTGDRAETARSIGTALGVDEVLAERSPVEKVAAVELERRRGQTIMVGDGINDAPALAVADLGVALAARGSSASSEAADVVLTVDRLDRLGEAMRIARRSRRIAVQSVVGGMVLALMAMVAAALGWLPPTAGALVQEVIDLLAILNALRAIRQPNAQDDLQGEGATLSRRFADEHHALGPRLDEIRVAADELHAPVTDADMKRLHSVYAFLRDDLLPHEMAEDAELYPALAESLGGRDPTGAMSRTHTEITHLIRRLGGLIDELGSLAADGTDRGDTEDVTELRRVLYGLHAILKLHFAQEDEEYFSLLPDGPVVPKAPMARDSASS